jgi:hypothetical protein
MIIGAITTLAMQTSAISRAIALGHEQPAETDLSSSPLVLAAAAAIRRIGRFL